MTIETIRLSEKAKTQLITLKRKTGIQNWNVLCRWAVIASIAEPSIPPYEEISTDSSVEMSWRVFSGDLGDAIFSIFINRLQKDKLNIEDEQTILNYFKIHLHRGISYLTSKEDLTDFFPTTHKTIAS